MNEVLDINGCYPHPMMVKTACAGLLQHVKHKANNMARTPRATKARIALISAEIKTKMLNLFIF